MGFVGEQSNAVLRGSAASARSVTSQLDAPSHSKIYISRLKFTAQDKLKTSKGSLSYDGSYEK